MNERIKELFKQTALHRNDHTTEQRLYEVEKFAELIVKECASIANYHSDGHYHDQFNRKLYQYHTDIGKEIVDYFGVEE